MCHHSNAPSLPWPEAHNPEFANFTPVLRLIHPTFPHLHLPAPQPGHSTPLYYCCPLATTAFLGMSSSPFAKAETYKDENGDTFRPPSSSWNGKWKLCLGQFLRARGGLGKLTCLFLWGSAPKEECSRWQGNHICLKCITLPTSPALAVSVSMGSS